MNSKYKTLRDNIEIGTKEEEGGGEEDSTAVRGVAGAHVLWRVPLLQGWGLLGRQLGVTHVSNGPALQKRGRVLPEGFAVTRRVVQESVSSREKKSRFRLSGDFVDQDDAD